MAVYQLAYEAGLLELDRELRQIMKEKGLRDADPFEEVVTRASIIDSPGGTGFRNIVLEASTRLAEACNLSAKELGDGFLEGTVVGMTPVSHGVALPHLRQPEIESAHLVLVRCPGGGDGCGPGRETAQSI